MLALISSQLTIWLSIKEQFAFSQSLNWAGMFNNFLYVKFQEDSIESFFCQHQYILAYRILFKLPNSLQTLKQKIMHSDKELDVEFVWAPLYLGKCVQISFTSIGSAALFSLKIKLFGKSQGRKKNGVQTNSSMRCQSGHYNPKQYKNHNSDNCWHLPPEIADPKHHIILNSGTSAHIFNNVRLFEHLELKDLDFIKMGKQGATISIKGRGLLSLNWEEGRYYSKTLDSKGCTVRLQTSNFAMFKGKKVVLKGLFNNALFSIDNPENRSRGEEETEDMFIKPKGVNQPTPYLKLQMLFYGVEVL
ncbi:hypothetical protein VP01_3312g5 [Puccinia sorghi]|uniref:Uncharacterized protein n=1 Tax=Puccinia sorghi TaxID=27349 RepID=A0A0L6UZ75_9BASI|nr:hypothetical protein VP01_3312g5 [Puccinia sorghi]